MLFGFEGVTEKVLQAAEVVLLRFREAVGVLGDAVCDPVEVGIRRREAARGGVGRRSEVLYR